jgi:hypothetical protein
LLESDNIYSSNLLKFPRRYALDWFEMTIWGDIGFEEWFLSWINNYLSFDLKESFGSQFYNSSIRNDDFGFKLFKDVKNNLKNPPYHLCCSGKFFQCQQSHDFIDYFISTLRSLEIKYNVCRCDAAIDLINEDIIPEPTRKNELPGKKVPIDYIANDLDGVKQWFAGKSGIRISVYNKFLDLAEKGLNYSDLYNIGEVDQIKSVWRIEVQMRSEPLKNLQKKVKLENCSDFFNEIIGQAGRRYKFAGIEIMPSINSTYLRKEKNSDVGSCNYDLQQCLKYYRRYIQKSNKLFNQDIYAYTGDTEKIQMFDLMSEIEGKK